MKVITLVKQEGGEMKPEPALITFHRGDDKTEFVEKWNETMKFLE